jgi:hypothetical protein
MPIPYPTVCPTFCPTTVEIFILGKSRYDLDVININKDRAPRQEKLRQLKVWRDTVAVLSASIEMTFTLDEMSDIDDG